MFNSGVSAISALLSLCPSGATIVVPEDFYSGTRYLMNKCFGDRFTYKVITPGNMNKELVQHLSEGGV